MFVPQMHTFTSFDGTRIAYSDEGAGPPVVLLHGFGVDALGQFGEFERTLPLLEKRQAMFRQAFGGAPPFPNPSPEGKPGLARALLAAGFRAIMPDMRGFGASCKPLEKSAYEDSAHSRDVAALLNHLHLDAVDIIGYSMGCGTAAGLLALHPQRVQSAIFAGVGDYVLEDNVIEFPSSWPIPDSVPRPITRSVWAEEGARILEQGEVVPGHLASASLIAARATGADPKVLAAVIRGAVIPSWRLEALCRIAVPILILNGRADLANHKIDGLLRAMPTARAASCEGDHHSTPYEVTFHQAVIRFFQRQ